MTASAPIISMEEMEDGTIVSRPGSSLAIWRFQPSRKLDLFLMRTTPAQMQVDSKNLWRAYTAFTQDTKVIAQVLVYWNGVETAGGYIIVRYLNLDFTLERRAMCMTDEVSLTTTCFARREHYIPILLQTRCLFLMNHQTGHDVRGPMPAYWTGESEWSLVSPAEGTFVRAFEFDIFVESLLLRTTTMATAHDNAEGGTKVKYYRPFFSTRDTTELVRAYEAKRRVTLRLDRGIVFTLAVLTADLASLLVLTLFVDPTWVCQQQLQLQQQQQESHIADESVRVLEAKRWRLGPSESGTTTEETSDIRRRLDRAVEKIHPTQQTGPHSCRSTTVCGGGNTGRHVLATYDPHRSVSLIEGEYLHISGDGWNNT